MCGWAVPLKESRRTVLPKKGRRERELNKSDPVVYVLKPC